MTVTGADSFDPQWVNVQFDTENSDGGEFRYYLSIPTTGEKSFLYGTKKTLKNYNDVDKFLKGVGYQLEYTTALDTLSAVFNSASEMLVGKTVSMRLGYYGNYIKFVGKTDAGVQYIIADKDGKDIVGQVFSGFDAAKAYAEESKIKIQGHMKCLDVIAADKIAPVGKLTLAEALPF